MDPLTHTLVGASLAATRLGNTTRFAVPALVIGANLPDVDVFSYLAGSDAALGFRRGWTHGVLALAVLPALLALLLRAWDAWRPPAASDRQISPGWIFALCYLAVLTHPSLDWLNTYGLRWWMPFDGTWYYGDAVFIMDPWIWLALGAGWLLGARPRRALVASWVIVTALLLLLVVRRAPAYTPVVGVVLAILLAALLWRGGGERFATWAAASGLVLATLFIGVMLLTQRMTERAVRAELALDGRPDIEQLMVGPVPVNPFVWEFVVRADGRLRHGRFSWLEDRVPRFSSFDRPDGRSVERWTEITASRQIPGFLDWARFPWIEAETPHADGLVRVFDARYARTGAGGVGSGGFGSAAVRLSTASPPP